LWAPGARPPSASGQSRATPSPRPLIVRPIEAVPKASPDRQRLLPAPARPPRLALLGIQLPADIERFGLGVREGKRATGGEGLVQCAGRLVPASLSQMDQALDAPEINEGMVHLLTPSACDALRNDRFGARHVAEIAAGPGQLMEQEGDISALLTRPVEQGFQARSHGIGIALEQITLGLHPRHDPQRLEVAAHFGDAPRPAELLAGGLHPAL